jgi:tartrate-resistant acid phosphatase type 5
MRPSRTAAPSLVAACVAAFVAVIAAPSRLQSQEADTADEVVPVPRMALPQLEQAYRVEKDDRKRVRIVQEMSWRAGAAELLSTIVENDPSDDVAVAAANAWRRNVLGGVVRSLERRGDSPRDTPGRERIRREAERYTVFALGQNLPHFMREAPPPFQVISEHHRRVRVLAFGDFGDKSDRQERTAAAMLRAHNDKRFDLAITLGDNFYPAGMTGPADPRWERDFERHYAAMRIPFLPSLGNHDWVLSDSPAAEVSHSARSKIWRMPAIRYTFTAGPAQFFALDTNLVTRAQLDWLDKELARSTAPWKIVYGHHPIHSDGVHGDEPVMRDRVLPLLRGRADLYICGHEHDLQHLAPQDGLHLVIAGGGGAAPRVVSPGPRSLFAASSNGFAIIEASRDNLAVSLVDEDLKVLHRFTITAANRKGR